ncbi:hypothetical protein RFI_16200 [Reticulomyxa filosa]|uniref:Uncharacterized protein n=1 Tax=Reticulomyxa filosa TaxID=46433 RepID=X6N5I7_RETFI|nr:hypothetical protein RFI_16200 [Reticulomyxa filosa]|eukprot:ETO21004.1 hypothetical protein RFI_16200 [Reticulomyxa filosa]
MSNKIIYISMFIVFLLSAVYLTLATMYERQALYIHTYVIIMLCPALVVYTLGLIQGYITFNKRYQKFLQLKAHLPKDEITSFIKNRLIFMAFPLKTNNDQTSFVQKNSICFFVVKLSTKKKNRRRGSMFGYPLNLKEFYSCLHNIVIIEWMVINERVLNDDEKFASVFEQMLRYVCGSNNLKDNTFGILNETAIYYAFCLSDEMMTWQHECLVDNGFILFHSWEDLQFCGISFPTKFLLFIKPLNAVALATRNHAKAQKTNPTTQNDATAQEKKD